MVSVETKKKQMITSCYRNLHKNCISVKTGKNRVRHSDCVLLENVRFHVNENGRQRVISEKRKNVHAFVKGYLVTLDCTCHINLDTAIAVTYNPYKGGHFYRRDNGQPVAMADKAVVMTQGIFAWNVK